MSWSRRPSCPFYCLHAVPARRALVGPMGCECALDSSAQRMPAACLLEIAGRRPDFDRCPRERWESAKTIARWINESWTVYLVREIWR